MSRIALIIAPVIAAATPGPAESQDRFSVRNDAGRAFSCGLRHVGRTAIERFVLHSGEEWHRPARGDDPRTLHCDSYKITDRWIMEPGVAYRLVVDQDTGRVVLLSIPEHH